MSRILDVLTLISVSLIGGIIIFQGTGKLILAVCLAGLFFLLSMKIFEEMGII